jgi:hypothetical protein
LLTGDVVDDFGEIGEFEAGFVEDVLDAHVARHSELLGGGVGGEDDNGEGVPAEVGAHDLEKAYAVDAGHAHVEDHRVGAAFDQLEQGVLTVLGAHDLMAHSAQEAGEKFSAVPFVVDHEHMRHTAHTLTGMARRVTIKSCFNGWGL